MLRGCDLALTGMRAAVSIGLVVCLFLSCAPAVTVADDSSDWQTVETENFVFKYKSGYSEDVEQVRDILQTGRQQLLNLVERSMAPSLDEKIRVTLHPGAEWTEGGGTLYWRSSDPVQIHLETPSDSGASTDWLEHGLLHEYANIILWDYGIDSADYQYWSRNPSWFAEGISEYLVYRTPLVQDQFPPSEVQAMNETIRNGGGYFDVVAESQYHGGHLLAMYMFEEYSDERIWDVFASDTDHFYRALGKSLDTEYIEFKRGWLTWAEENVGGDYNVETSDSSSNTGELEARISTLENQLSMANQTIRRLKTTLENRNQSLDRLRFIRDRQNQTISSLRTNITRAENRISKLENHTDEQSGHEKATIIINVEPSGTSESYLQGQNASVDVDIPNSARSGLQLSVGSAEYNLQSSSSLSIPLERVGVVPLNVTYGSLTISETISVAKPDGRGTVAATLTETPENPTPNGGSNEGVPGFGISAGIVAAVLVVLWIVTRRG